MWCQRPERAYFISTKVGTDTMMGKMVCQRPERAYFISTAVASCIGPDDFGVSTP